NTAATLCTSSSSRAFSANSGQSDAGSTTTASSFLPSSPPAAFCCSISISIVSLSVVSLIAIVPDSECSTPTLIVSSADAPAAPNASAAPSTRPPRILRTCMSVPPVSSKSDLDLHAERERVDVRTGEAGQVRVAARHVQIQPRVVAADDDVQPDLGQVAVLGVARLVRRVADVRLPAERAVPRQEIRDRDEIRVAVEQAEAARIVERERRELGVEALVLGLKSERG